MKIVIDIDDELYKAICDCDSPQIISHVSIKNGTPYEERPHGEWKLDGTCSECGVYSSLNKDTTYFCPNCGSDNRPKIHGCSFASEECAKNPCADCGLREGEAK